MAIVDPVAAPHAHALLECLRGEIAKALKPPGEVCMRAGDQVNFLISLNEDECCTGLAWVRIAGYPAPSTVTFPDADVEPSKCLPSRWAVVLEMGYVTCAPVGTDTTLPTCDEWTDLHEALASADAAFRRAILCCYAADPGNLFVIGPGTPLPIQGGCAGITRQITVAADANDCCDVEDSP